MFIAPTTSAFSSNPQPTHRNRACVRRLCPSVLGIAPKPLLVIPEFAGMTA